MSNEQRTAVHGTKEQLAAALHTVTVERDALRQQFDGNAELCVICGELCSSYAGNPNKWPVRLGNDSWRHIGCVNKQLAEHNALRWTCFHCGETFTIPGLAAEHFGYADGDTPACKIKAGHERNLVAALRDAQCELDRYRAEDSDKDREFHAMRADHATALRREEEAGYNKGVRDMTAERDALRQALEEARRRLQDIATDDLDYGDEPLAAAALHAHGALARIDAILKGRPGHRGRGGDARGRQARHNQGGDNG